MGKHLQLLGLACLFSNAHAQISSISLPFQIIVGLLIFLFAIPAVCMVLHLIRVQVNKIQNAHFFDNSIDPDLVEDDESEG